MSLARRLTHAQVLELRARVAAGETQAAVAHGMSLDRATVSKWIGHDRMPALTSPTKAELARLRQEACEMKRADPNLGAVTCAGRLGVHQTTVTTWWQDAGLMRVDLRQPAPGPDPWIDLIEVEYVSREQPDPDAGNDGLYGLRWSARRDTPASHVPYQSSLAGIG